MASLRVAGVSSVDVRETKRGSRTPIVAVLGHVDHGWTSALDAFDGGTHTFEVARRPPLTLQS